MTVAGSLVTVDVETCGACSGVLPARSAQQCTNARARALLEKGFCMCPLIAQQIASGLAALAPATQELYSELVALAEGSVSYRDCYEESPTAVDLAPVDDPPDVEVVAPGAALTVVETRTSERGWRRIKVRRKVKTTKMLQLKPVNDPVNSTRVWMHPDEAPSAGPPTVPVIDGGGVITGPQQLPPLQRG